MARTGRPKTQIDQRQFEVACGFQCTEEEICDLFGCCEDTLNSWCKETYKDENGKPMTFSEVFKQKRNRGKASLRRSQFQLSKKNATMAIFLGKQYLNQRDQVAIEHNAKNNLLEAIMSTKEVNTDDLPEVQ